MEDFRKGDYIAIELGGIGNRTIYCILNEVLDYASGKPHRLVGHIYIYNNTLLPVGEDIIKNIEIRSNDKVRQCNHEEFATINNILLKNDIAWNPSKNVLISTKESKTPHNHTIKAYIGESRYIPSDKLNLLLRDLKKAVESEALAVNIMTRETTGLVYPKILDQTRLSAIVEFKIKRGDIVWVFDFIGQLKKFGIELLYLEIE